MPPKKMKAVGNAVKKKGRALRPMQVRSSVSAASMKESKSGEDSGSSIGTLPPKRYNKSRLETKESTLSSRGGSAMALASEAGTGFSSFTSLAMDDNYHVIKPLKSAMMKKAQGGKSRVSIISQKPKGYESIQGISSLLGYSKLSLRYQSRIRTNLEAVRRNSTLILAP